MDERGRRIRHHIHDVQYAELCHPARNRDTGGLHLDGREPRGGTQGPLSLLNQSPHSLVWDVDALGFIFLSLSTLFAFPVFEKRGLQLWVRRFLANALIIPLSCIAYFYPGYSVGRLLFAKQRSKCRYLLRELFR